MYLPSSLDLASRRGELLIPFPIPGSQTRDIRVNMLTSTTKKLFVINSLLIASTSAAALQPKEIKIITTTPLSAFAAKQCSVNVGLPGGVYLCHQTSFAGGCNWYPPTTRLKSEIPCMYNFPKKANFSVGPDYGGYCQFFEKADCKGRLMKITSKDIPAEE